MGEHRRHVDEGASLGFDFAPGCIQSQITALTQPAGTSLLYDEGTSVYIPLSTEPNKPTRLLAVSGSSTRMLSDREAA